MADIAESRRNLCKWKLSFPNKLPHAIVQQRNKPKEPTKIPEKAPFFLPSLSGEMLKFDLNHTIKEGSEQKKKESSRLEKNRAAETESEFQRLLKEDDLTCKLKSISK